MVYELLLKGVANYGAMGQLVLRRTMGRAKSCEAFLGELSPWICVTAARAEWPGTRLVDNLADVVVFELCTESLTILFRHSCGLYSWIQPELPEDLCILRHDSSPILATISHERDGWLSLLPSELEQLRVAVPSFEEFTARAP